MGRSPTARNPARGRPASFACLLLLLSCLAVQAQESSLEEAVKATYLYKLAPFVEWPPTAFASRSSALNLCVVGDDEFGALADRAASGQRVGDRPISVMRLQAASPDSGCHIMYVAGSGEQTVTEALNIVRGTPVLTITDSGREVGERGIVNLVIQDNRVRFEIDDYTAAQNGIVISSKLLDLALSVRRRSG